MWWRARAALVVVCAAASRAEQIADCATCHPAESKLHTKTRMSHAMRRAFESGFAQNLPEQPLRESGDGFAFTYRREGNGIEVSAMRGSSQAQGLIEWVLGAGAQGETPLVRSVEGVRESRVSYFPQLHQYGITIGQEPGASADAEAALGLKKAGRDLRECVGCHSSAVTSDFEPVTAGVQCARCHLGAEEHARGGTKPPLNPGKLSGPQQVQFCGNCHRNKPPVDDAQLENLRFQPLRLMKSRCFASGKLACTTCHVAHQDARRNDPDFYNATCHACHDGQRFHADARQRGDCIGCHMPYVELHPALHFTDHFIRVVKGGDLPASIVRQRGAKS